MIINYREREQWASGCNFLALAPGQVLSYARNEFTLAGLEETGFRIVDGESLLLGDEEVLEDDKVAITFEGADRAGNRAEAVSVEEITYDVTAPVIAGFSPVDSSEVNHTRFSYTLSESMAEGAIRWIWTGGVEDTASSHYFELSPEQLVLGSSDDIFLVNPPALADGAVYAMEIFGSDAAGNIADSAST